MIKRILIILFFVIIVVGATAAWFGWTYILKPNVHSEKAEVVFHIYTGDTYNDLLTRLEKESWLFNLKTFKWVSEKMNLPAHIYPGRYVIKSDLNNRELITLLRSGIQQPLNITFNNLRTNQDLAGRLSKQIETDSLEIIERLQDPAYAEKYGFTLDNFRCMFIPNTYEVYWNIKPNNLFRRFFKEYNNFWNNEKLLKAKQIGFTPIEISIIASIVEKETSFYDEYATVAGVYINRLNKKIPLQADPTVIFAIGDFGIKRVLNKHLEFDSPYNTYKNRGLPPGPICIPSIQAINSVLNYKSHKYLYFCAKDDFSGRHVFAKTLRQHNQNARKYRKALDKNRIYK